MYTSKEFSLFACEIRTKLSFEAKYLLYLNILFNVSLDTRVNRILFLLRLLL